MLTFYFKDLIDCSSDPCHLAWLAREDSFLLNFVYEAECSDGTKLKYLSKDYFANCLVYCYNSNFSHQV